MTTAVIVAAGSGTRMGDQSNKLFLKVAGMPVVVHAWRRFDESPRIDQIVVVVRDGDQSAFDGLAATYRFTKPYKIVPGGKARQDSVWNGLMALDPQCDIVAIHDGARPCPSPSLIQNTIDSAATHGAAVAASRVTDTIKSSDDGQTVSGHLDRPKLWAVQTPQCFRVDIIKRALAAVRERGLQVTDDTAACELIGQPVWLVESDLPNPKVTVPADLAYVELLMAKR